jgi:hypothetical protein
MNGARLALLVAIGLALSALFASAQDLTRYRAYALESSFDTVMAISGARAADAKILHVRPARIQQIEWRAAYARIDDAQADPVRQLTFSFVDDALYQVIVNYDRTRTDGLTNADVIGLLTATYGAPSALSARDRASSVNGESIYDTVVVARWETSAASLTLLRAAYTPEFQLVLVSKPLNTRAQNAIREATRLDAIEAPQRALDQQKKEATDADAAREKARTTNKAAFRP